MKKTEYSLVLISSCMLNSLHFCLFKNSLFLPSLLEFNLGSFYNYFILVTWNSPKVLSVERLVDVSNVGIESQWKTHFCFSGFHGSTFQLLQYSKYDNAL